jgi:hypothetical protein
MARCPIPFSDGSWQVCGVSTSEAQNMNGSQPHRASSTGVLSYVYVKIFKSFAGNNMFSSMTCPSLSSSTILQVPRTHVLFSLASSAPKIASQEFKTRSRLQMATYSTTIFEAFRQRSNELYSLRHFRKGYIQEWQQI